MMCKLFICLGLAAIGFTACILIGDFCYGVYGVLTGKVKDLKTYYKENK